MLSIGSISKAECHLPDSRDRQYSRFRLHSQRLETTVQRDVPFVT